MPVTTDVTRELRSGPGTTFGLVFKVKRSDGSLFTDSTGGLTSGKLTLSVANGNALTGFQPSPTYGGLEADPVIADIVQVYGYTASKNDAGGALTAVTGSVLLDKSSFVKDPADASNTSVKCDIYMTSAAFAELMIVCPQ